jgi:uncharacterized protein YeaO (DUF488 family)
MGPNDRSAGGNPQARKRAARPHRIAIKRAYELRAHGDGVRVLVDRLWPRGLRKVDAGFDLWRKDLAPTTELRQFYGHRPERFAEFRRRYLAELRRAEAAAAVAEMIEINRRRPVTFLTASRDLDHSEAAVLADHIRSIIARRARDAGKPDRT